MIHALADVKSTKVGQTTNIWQFSVVLEHAEIGENCNLNCHTFVENDVVIGDRVTIKSGVYLWDGITLKDDVFIGPNVTFTNDVYPRSKQYPDEFKSLIVHKGASIGAGSTILGGIEVGEYALIGAGSLVTKNVKPFALVIGHPAKQVGWVNKQGQKLKEISTDLWECPNGELYKVIQENLIKNEI